MTTTAEYIAARAAEIWAGYTKAQRAAALLEDQLFRLRERHYNPDLPDCCGLLSPHEHCPQCYDTIYAGEADHTYSAPTCPTCKPLWDQAVRLGGPAAVDPSIWDEG